jgi:hypothetical protein
MDRVGIEEDPLGDGRLAGVDVRGDADVANARHAMRYGHGNTSQWGTRERLLDRPDGSASDVSSRIRPRRQRIFTTEITELTENND